MSFRGITEQIVHNFFVIFTCSVLVYFIFMVVSGDGTAELAHIAILFFTSGLTDLTQYVFCSKKELSRTQILVRHSIHLLLILGIMLTAATLAEWIAWSKPLEIILFIVSVVAVYVFVVVIEELRNRKLVAQLNKKLKERYKG